MDYPLKFDWVSRVKEGGREGKRGRREEGICTS